MQTVYAYDKMYLAGAQRALGDMYDFAVHTLAMDLAEFEKLFLVSDVSHQLEVGNPAYIAGKNGCELARDVVEECTGEMPAADDFMVLDKSPEYWIGWTLAYYQWLRGCRFAAIEQALPTVEMYALYPTYHEADISLVIDVIDARMEKYYEISMLKRLRKYAGLSQQALAEKADVPLRQIQLFEQRQREITKTQGQTLVRLAKALSCRPEDLLDKIR